MYFNTKLGVHVTPVGVVLLEHRAGVKSNTRGVNFNTTVFAVFRFYVNKFGGTQILSEDTV